MFWLGQACWAGCRDCAQSPFGGPSDNRFTAYDTLCAGDLCRTPGLPQVSVNLASLALYIRVADLPFGGPAPGFSLERSFNVDDPTAGPFGIGWSFTLGESLAFNPDGSVVVRRASGLTDRFVAGPAGLAAVTATPDSLSQNGDGTYTLRTSGGATTRLFTADGRLSAIAASGVSQATLDYDSSGHIATAHYRGRAVAFTYDSAGHITAVSDGAGRAVSYSYSGNQLAGQANADGSSVQYLYDDSGNLASINYAGAVTTISYNSDPPFNSVSAITTPDGATRRYDVPLTPTQIRFTDGKGNPVLYVSNTLGLVQSITDANGNTMSYAYDAAGRRTQMVNGAGETLKLAYDGGGNLIAATDSAGKSWQADYTAAAIAHLTDPNGNTWVFKYDTAGNLAAVTNPGGGTASATRSPAGQIAGLADAAGNQTSYQYDANGLLSAFTDALNGKWAWQYDAAARPASRTDPGGAALQAGYGVSLAVASLTAGNATQAFDYSGQQRDGLNRLSGYTDSFGNQIGYTYDAAGQLTGMTLPGGNTVTWQYDRAHRLVQVADWLGNFALYRYDTAGSPASVNVSGGPVTLYQYDTARRLRAIVSTGPDGSPVAGYRYAYDAAGNRTSVSALEPSAAPAPITDYTLNVDAAGHPTIRSDGQVYSYDPRGYLTAIGGSRTAALAYDAFGRLQSFNAESSTAYAYDAAGLRVARTVNGNTRRFVYDLSGAAPRVVMETGADNTPVAWYIYGLGLLWKVTADGTAYFYHFDGDGNVVALSNPAMGVVNQYRYDPSGRLASVNEGVENMFRARGGAGWVDDGNGLLLAGSVYQYPELRLALPAAADPSLPVPNLLPTLPGAGACFLNGVSACAFAGGRSAR